MNAATNLATLGQQLTDLEVELNAAETNLVDLDTAWSAQAEQSPPLTGASADLLTAINATTGSLWKDWTALQTVIRRARQLHDDAGRVADLDELLNGKSVTLGGDLVPLAHRTLTGAHRNQKRRQPSDVISAMGLEFTKARDDLARLSSARANATKSGDDLSGRIGVLTSEPTSPLVCDVDAARLLALTAQLDADRTDPLTLARACTVGEATVDSIEAAVRALGAAKVGLGDRLDRNAKSLLELQQHWRSIRSQTGLAVTTVGAAPLDPKFEIEVDDATRRLSARLAELGTQSAINWKQTVEGLDRWEAVLARLTAEFDRLGAPARAALARRDELEGLLDGSQAKARDEGASEDPALAALAEQAKAELRATPCDLDVAEKTVRAYLSAVRSRARRFEGHSDDN